MARLLRSTLSSGAWRVVLGLVVMLGLGSGLGHTVRAQDYTLGVLAAGVDFYPSTFSGSLRSHLATNGAWLFWTDGTEWPVKGVPLTGGPAIPLVRTISVPEGVTVRGASVYSVHGGRLYRSSLDGTSVTLLAEGDRSAASGVTADVVADDTHVFWANSVPSLSCSPPCTFEIRRVPVAGGAGTTLATVSKRVVALAADATHVYWEEDRFPDPAGPQSELRRIAKGGGTPETLVAGLRGLRGGLAVEGGQVFFADTGFSVDDHLMKVAVTGGAVTTLANLSSADGKTPRSIASDGVNVYWLDDGPSPSANDGSLRSVPVAGGAVTPLATGLGSGGDVAIHGSDVVWTDNGCCLIKGQGSVKRLPVTGGTPTTLASGLNIPGALALDATHLYWVEGGSYGEIEGWGRVARLPHAGGIPANVLNTTVGPMAVLAADATHVYFANKFTLKKVPIAGGGVEDVAIGSFHITDVEADGVNVYWVEGPFSMVRKAPVGGGPAVTLGVAGSGPPGPMAIDQTHVYVVDHDDAIRRVPIAGGPVTTVADDLPFLSDLTTDGTHVYFSENDTGAIRKVPVAGGPITDLVSLFGFTWRMLAVSQGNVYWIDQEDVGKVPTSGGAPQYLLEDVFSDVFVPNAIVAHGPNVFFTEVAGGLVTGAYSVLPTPTTLSVADCAAVEGNAGVTTCGFRVTLSAPTSVAVAARYQVTGGTASAGDDYVAAEGTVMVPAGATEITLPVGIAGDTIQEANETFALTLGSAVNAALGDGQATGTILDDEASGFHTVEPCRVVDTRLPVGPAGGPSVATGAVRVFPAAGACGIPADAGAIAVNVTVVRPSGQGFLVLFPADAALPVASTINFRAGAVRGNNAVVTLGTDGRLAVRCAMFTAGTTDVVIDVFGYFR